MGLIHEQDKILKTSQILKVALTDVLGKALDPRGFPTANFRVDLRDIEDVDMHFLAESRQGRMAGCDAGLVVVSRNDRGRLRGKFSNTGKDILRRIRREVGDEFVIDRQVRREHKEVIDAMRSMEIADKRAHQPSLPDAGGQGETERRELPLKVRNARKLALYGVHRGGNVGSFLRRDHLGHAIENFKGRSLRSSQTQTTGDGIDVSVHRPLFTVQPQATSSK